MNRSTPAQRQVRAMLRAEPDMADRLLTLLAGPSQPVGSVIQGASEAVAALSPLVRGRDIEALAIAFLGSRRRLLGAEILSIGGLHSTVVDQRAIYRRALMRGAAAIVLAHNHPSGDPTPSREDIETTRIVRDAGRVIGIELVDHIVIVNDGRYSSIVAAWPTSWFGA